MERLLSRHFVGEQTDLSGKASDSLITAFLLDESCGGDSCSASRIGGSLDFYFRSLRGQSSVWSCLGHCDFSFGSLSTDDVSNVSCSKPRIRQATKSVQHCFFLY